MLISLKIQNLILIDSEEIAFYPGLNILTGETGSGKSAVLLAIQLISGERIEGEVIRDGADKAIIEASFSNDSIVRREIYRSGKNRCFVNDEQVNLSFLRSLSAIERVDQTSSLELMREDVQRDLLDTFAGASSLAGELALFLAEEKQKETKLQEIEKAALEKEKELEYCSKDLLLIEEVNWQPGEEEKLSQEHTLLTHAQELVEKLGSVSTAFLEGGEPIAPLLKRFSAILDSCARFDPKIQDAAKSVRTAALEIEESGFWLRSYIDRLEVNPEQLVEVEKRIASIEMLKRRFGGCYKSVQKQKEGLSSRINRLSQIDDEAASLKNELEELKKQNLEKAHRLSLLRKEAAQKLSQETLKELKTLNLPHAKFVIEIKPKPLSLNGLDSISFEFSANPGSLPAPLNEAPSGGELSRLLLAIKITTAEKANSSCLVFDEIDSNVGGQTAAILGEKLKVLSQKRQVICVTHFVQVAKCAMHHLLVYKTEEKGKALTKICSLELKEREKEYSRMQGLLK